MGWRTYFCWSSLLMKNGRVNCSFLITCRQNRHLRNDVWAHRALGEGDVMWWAHWDVIIGLLLAPSGRRKPASNERLQRLPPSNGEIEFPSFYTWRKCIKSTEGSSGLRTRTQVENGNGWWPGGVCTEWTCIVLESLDYAPHPDLWLSPLPLSLHIQHRFCLFCRSLHSSLSANIVMFIRRTFLLCSLLSLLKLARCMESELCFPVRLDTHNNDDRRDFDNDLENLNGECVIKIRAFQQELVIDLQKDSNFIAPSLSNQDALWLSNTDATTDLSRCFYSGYVNADSYSYAALSLCKGLQGAFGFQGWEYFISPVQNDTRSAESAHIVRRRPINNLRLNSTSRCAVDSDLSAQVAQSLEKYKRLNDYSNVTETMLRRMGRSKRFASVPRYVETLVVADESMAQFHGDDLKHYLLTLMSVAARLYKHPSILNFISITVVKIVIISEEDKGPKVSGNAAMTLRNFCTWQKKLNKNNDKHADYWDTAILFTRQVKPRFICVDTITS